VHENRFNRALLASHQILKMWGSLSTGLCQGQLLLSALVREGGVGCECQGGLQRAEGRGAGDDVDVGLLCLPRAVVSGEV
jgi:hypothetical protein